MNHSAKSGQRKVKKFTGHTVACKLRRISGGRVAPPVTFRVQRSDDRKYVCVCRLATQGIVPAVVRSGLNVRSLKLPIQIPLNQGINMCQNDPCDYLFIMSMEFTSKQFKVRSMAFFPTKQIFIVSLLRCCCSSFCTRLFHKETECCKRLRIWVWRIRRCCNTQSILLCMTSCHSKLGMHWNGFLHPGLTSTYHRLVICQSS